jgi:hypothetical protein
MDLTASQAADQAATILQGLDADAKKAGSTRTPSSASSRPAKGGAARTAIQSLDCRGSAPRAPRRKEPRSLVRARSAADWQTMDNSGQKRSPDVHRNRRSLGLQPSDLG